MIDLRVDLSAVQSAKDLKNGMLQRLRQIDFDSTGLISMDSFISISEKYGIKLNAADIKLIKDKYKRSAQSSKIDYIKVLNQIKMKLDLNGSIEWVFGSKGNQEIPYRIKISRVSPNDEDETLSTKLSIFNKHPQTTRNSLFATMKGKTSIRTARGNQSLDDADQNNTIDFIMLQPGSKLSGNKAMGTLPQVTDKISTQGNEDIHSIALPHIGRRSNSTIVESQMQTQISPKMITEIKRQFKVSQLEIKTLFGLKWEFSRRDISGFSFANDQEFKFFIENLNITLPDQFIVTLYETVINSQTKKLNFVLLKQFIDVCQDTVLLDENSMGKQLKSLIYGDDSEQGDQTLTQQDLLFTDEFKNCAREIEQKLNERYFSLRNAYRSFDGKKNGFVSETEFIEGLVHLNVNLSEVQMRLVFKELDRNNVGGLNFETFCQIVLKKQIKLDNNLKLLNGIAQDFESRSIRNIQSRMSSLRSVRSVTKPTNVNSQFKANIVKNQNDILKMYDQIESSAPSSRIKRKLQIANLKTPEKLSDQQRIFGKKVDKSESIEKIIAYDYLNDAIRQKLRDKFVTSREVSDIKKIKLNDHSSETQSLYN